MACPGNFRPSTMIRKIQSLHRTKASSTWCEVLSIIDRKNCEIKSTLKENIKYTQLTIFLNFVNR